MPSGEVHYVYYKKWSVVTIPTSIVIMFVDFQFGLGNLLGYWSGRWV